MKKRARRQLIELSSEPVNSYEAQYIGVESYYDSEYEALFETSALNSLADRNNNESELVKWPTKLTAITIEHPWMPPCDINEKDPRRTRYLQIRAEILHKWYDASTPEHWGTAEHPMLLE